MNNQRRDVSFTYNKVNNKKENLKCWECGGTTLF